MGNEAQSEYVVLLAIIVIILAMRIPSLIQFFRPQSASQAQPPRTPRVIITQNVMRWFFFWFLLSLFMAGFGLMAAHHVGLRLNIVDAIGEDRLDVMLLAQEFVATVAIALGLIIFSLVTNSVSQAATPQPQEVSAHITWRMALAYVSNRLIHVVTMQFFVFTLIIAAIDWNGAVITPEAVIVAEVVVFALSCIIDARRIKPMPLSIGMLLLINGARVEAFSYLYLTYGFEMVLLASFIYYPITLVVNMLILQWRIRRSALSTQYAAVTSASRDPLGIERFEQGHNDPS